MMKFKLYLLSVCCLIFLISINNLSAKEDVITPFKPGEKLIYRIKWSFIPAGHSSLEIMPFKYINGKRSYHFKMLAQTNSVIDKIYKVRDEINAYASFDMDRSVHYVKKVREGKNKRDVVVTFDWEKNKAQYSNFGKKFKAIALLPGAFDPLSAFFYFRLFDPAKISEINVPVTDGKKCIVGKARRIKRVKKKVKAGEFDTFLVEPELKHIKGVFEKSKDATLQIWVTADERRIPVMLRSKVIVGSFYVELVSIN